jgi:heat shock protein HslJ
MGIHKTGVRVGGVLLSALFVSCAEGVNEPSDLMGGTWKLRSMEPVGGPSFTPENPDLFTVDFGSNGQISVVADCNSCGGSYTVEDGTVAVSELVCTLIGCSGGTAGQQFATLVEGRASADVDGDELILESSEGTLRLRR